MRCDAREFFGIPRYSEQEDDDDDKEEPKKETDQKTNLYGLVILGVSLYLLLDDGGVVHDSPLHQHQDVRR